MESLGKFRDSNQIDPKAENDLSSILVISPSLEDEEFNNSHSSSNSASLSLQSENQILKRQCEALKIRLEHFEKSSISSPQNSIPSIATIQQSNGNYDPKDEYVDVNCLVIFEKIEEHLKETNRIFKDSSKLIEAFVYMVKNFWSLTAYMYSDSNLNEAKLLRDELLRKIEEIDCSETISAKENKTESLLLLTTGPSLVKSDTDLLSSLNLDMDFLQSCKANTETLQAKLFEQNSILKSFLKDIEVNNFEDEKLVKLEKLKLKFSTENSKIADVSKQNDDAESKSEADNDYTSCQNFSPGTSPSSFFMNKFDGLLKQTENINKAPSLENEETNKTMMESDVSKKEITQASSESIPQTPTTITISNNSGAENSTLKVEVVASLETNETRNAEHQDDSLYLYCVNDGEYIGVNSSLELDPNRETATNNNLTEEALFKIDRSNVENHVMFDEINNNLAYKCPKVRFCTNFEKTIFKV